MTSLLRLAVAGLVGIAAGWAGSSLLPKLHSQAGYAGLQDREIKTLSDEEVAGLRQAKGLGYALAAELNGYPGPRHVLELADKLSLTEAQRQQTEALIAKMTAEAAGLGERLIAAEQSLNQKFADRAIDAVQLKKLTDESAALDSALRSTHLSFHLAMMEVLSPAQVAEYASLRGYAGGGHTGH
jgi:Spy/CpxP family protein refolding chaperone